MKKFAALLLLFSFSLCASAHLYSPVHKDKPEKDYKIVVKEGRSHDLKPVNMTPFLNDHLVIDLVTPASEYRLYDEEGRVTLDEVKPVANAPPESHYQFGYSMGSW